MPEPFLVLATQNPIESEGTYPLPEAQVDRFMFKVVITYPSSHEEIDVVERVTTTLPEVDPVLKGETLLEMQRLTDAIYVDAKVMEYAVTLATATRRPGEVGLPDLARYISYGASPRASVNMILGAKALALLRGREFVMVEDVRDIAPEVMRHRFVLSYEALADDVTADHLVERFLERVEAPRVHIGDPHDARGGEAVTPAAPVPGEGR